MKNLIWMTLALSLGFLASGKDEDVAEAINYTPLVFELSWFDAENSDRGGMGFKDIKDQGYFSFATSPNMRDTLVSVFAASTLAQRATSSSIVIVTYLITQN